MSSFLGDRLKTVRTMLSDRFPVLSVCLSCLSVTSDVGVLWSNGWIDQDETWHGGRPRPRRHCVRLEPWSAQKGGTAPPILAYVYCGQTAGWIRMPLGMAVGLGPGHIMLDGTQLPPKKGTALQFSPISVVAKRLDGLGFRIPLGAECGGTPLGRQATLDGDPAPPRKGAQR